MPRSKLPSTLKRSPKKAQDTYEETLENAEREYGDQERAHRTAYAALKHSFEKVGNRWEPKARRGPSDPEGAAGGDPKKHPDLKSFRGVDYYGHTKDELYERAKKLGIQGRSKMAKEQLAEAIGRKQK
jgi:cation transport regulator ChaB